MWYMDQCVGVGYGIWPFTKLVGCHLAREGSTSWAMHAEALISMIGKIAIWSFPHSFNKLFSARLFNSSRCLLWPLISGRFHNMKSHWATA